MLIDQQPPTIELTIEQARAIVRSGTTNCSTAQVEELVAYMVTTGCGLWHAVAMLEPGCPCYCIPCRARRGDGLRKPCAGCGSVFSFGDCEHAYHDKDREPHAYE